MSARCRWALALALWGLLHLIVPYGLAMTGLCFLALSAVLGLLELAARRGAPRAVSRVLIALPALSAGIVLAGTVYIVAQPAQQLCADAPPQYVVVLGAQIHADQPSRTLRERLDCAADYLTQHPDTLCIVTGGQGADEQQTEASVMAAYLTRIGIDPARIIPESDSHNTRENLQNAARIAADRGLDAARPLIVTSDFHTTRARYIAGTLRMTPSTLGSRTTPRFFQVNYALREVFAFVKAVIVAHRA